MTLASRWGQVTSREERKGGVSGEGMQGPGLDTRLSLGPGHIRAPSYLVACMAAGVECNPSTVELLLSACFPGTPAKFTSSPPACL